MLRLASSHDPDVHRSLSGFVQSGGGPARSSGLRGAVTRIAEAPCSRTRSLGRLRTRRRPRWPRGRRTPTCTNRCRIEQSGAARRRTARSPRYKARGAQKFVLQGGHVRKSWDEAPPLALSSGSHWHAPLVAYCWATVFVVVAFPRSRTLRVTSTEQLVLGGKLSGVVKLRTIAKGSLVSRVMLPKPPLHVVASSEKNAVAGVAACVVPRIGEARPSRNIARRSNDDLGHHCEIPPLPLSLSQSLVTSFPNV